MTLSLLDAHCHLHDERLWSRISPGNCRTLESVRNRACSVHLSHVVSCATHAADWQVLEQLLRQTCDDNSLQIVPSFGVHPWWTHELQEGTLITLRDILTRHPSACVRLAKQVGEIGLCKSARGRCVPLDVQEAAFREQLELAAELERTCVVHCVGYYGKLLEILQGQVRKGCRLPPAIVLHSYSGTPEMVRSFMALQGTRFYFSMNAKQLSDPRMRKAAACCAALPIDTLLLETDAPDQAPAVKYVETLFTEVLKESAGLPLLLQEGTAGVNEPAMVYLALVSATQIRGVEIEELAAAVLQNSKAAFALEN